jgi:RNA polymerase sigma-70 factor, ECF subfamily
MIAKGKKVSDSELVEQFCRGSMEAFEELLSRYEAKVFNIAMRFTRNQEDAEEVLQDVFTTLYRKLAGFEGKAAFSSWLYRIVVNAAFMKLRKRKQSTTTSFDDLPESVQQLCFDGDAAIDNRSDTRSQTREIRRILEEAVGRLPEQYRAVFMLRDMEGLSNQEVSDILDISIPAVKSRLHRSRLMLRKRLHRYYEDFTGTKVQLDEEQLAIGNM